MLILDDKELEKSLKAIDWRKLIDWGTVKVVIKKGQPVSITIEQTIKIE